MPLSASSVNHQRKSNGEAPKTGWVVPDVVPSRYFRFSPWVSRILAAVLLIPAVPIILLCILIIRLTSPGPGIFRQFRVGRHGRLYYMYKLRTMREDAEAESGPVWTQPADPRITRVGRILRRLHLDELPQLFNVVKGEMALIGPRPERPEFVQLLARQIPGYLNRLFVLPGITGLAQINLPPDTTVDCVCRKLTLDVEYVKNASLPMDLRIYSCTLVRLFGVRGTGPARVLGLAYNVPQLMRQSAPVQPPDDSARLMVGQGVLHANGRKVPLPPENGTSASRRKAAVGSKTPRRNRRR